MQKTKNNIKPKRSHLLVRDIRLFGIKTIPIKLFNAVSIVLSLHRATKNILNRVQYFYIKRTKFCPIFLSYIFPRPKGVRRYISPRLGIERTFIELNKASVRYVILRWHHDLPNWPEMEDIDILVHDEDLPKLDSLFVWYSSSTPVDIYTISAKLGWNDMPYHPPHKSKDILETRELYRNHYYIPSQDDRFYCLAYHAVVRKGMKAGLPVSESIAENTESEHDYAFFLEQDRPDYISTDLTLDSLWQALDKAGWIPKLDTLAKLSTYNQWIKTKIPHSEFNPTNGELMVFVIREAAHKMQIYHTIIDWFAQHRHAFTIIQVHQLNDQERLRASQAIRGGEWGKGCYPKSGGEPATFIVVYDYSPQYPDYRNIQNETAISNLKYNIKHELRDTINRNHLFINRRNIIHSPDNEREALEYLDETLDPNSHLLITKAINLHRNRCTSSYPVIERMSKYGRRAKVELIKYNNTTAIKKTFKVGEERYLARELFAYETLAECTTLIPRLLDHGDGYLIIEKLSISQRAFNFDLFRTQIMSFLRLLYNKGYFFLDLHQENILVTGLNQIKIIDFEYLQKYKSQPDHFTESYDLVGVPDNLGYDLPKNYPNGVLEFRKKLLNHQEPATE